MGYYYQQHLLQEAVRKDLSMDQATKALTWLQTLTRIRNDYKRQADRGRAAAARQLAVVEGMMEAAVLDVKAFADEGHEASIQRLKLYRGYLPDDDSLPF